ncbi:hypothetical protein [Alkaliphilus serpentinus]|uniref:Uncharacterized protein n=1 Tax=Alkaliphilus serpentinus TaxID=1482731 RepID=A0A833HPQ6_9FIRM|nr:hypothetical protein [Alkaliphilus serpentinus]KAB3531097.1 hypothetical protein F8153_05535 [Alkaliphilus serpentinus]
MRKKKYYQRLYKYEESTNKYLIEVSLDDYNDIYDDWDPSPFKKRDIEDEFNDFIVNSSEDIPLRFNICILLYIPLSKQNHLKERSLISAYRNFYSYAIARQNKVKSNLEQRIVSYLLFSVLFLTIGYFYSGSKSTILLKVLFEGIFIGGWVFLWEFFTSIFITRREVLEEYKTYERLLNAEIRFHYLEDQ